MINDEPEWKMKIRMEIKRKYETETKNEIYKIKEIQKINQSNIQKLFEKKFCFINKNYKLPDCTAAVLYSKQNNHKFPQLQEIKESLNDVKNKLNDYPREKWSEHTRKRNPAGEIILRVRLFFFSFKFIQINFDFRLKMRYRQNS